MKKAIYIFLISMLTTVSVSAQELTWHTDMGQASEFAIKEKKPLLMFFTGSDWCGWCIRLQNEVFKTDEFRKWANENVVLVELDFPRRTPQEDKIKAQNYQLQSMFQVRGYPTIWFVNPEMNSEKKISLKKLGSTGYVAGGPTKWIGAVASIL
ncbi:thioredoxin family protein [Flavivirga aquimarina]|uniref:Thioredoxin family protein n=1 Tax=Flavivirga aquimarina TaxID=2027862 RepID=A0ABT8WCE4_9FLAO|nr:thioredoxin fold domain-containing protein [Flavivirga aquimarina]MDO5970817.1 thioredoxin family protein [Flavivirga aquimarina]